MLSAKWAVMKQMKKLTKRKTTKIILQSLPIVILAAIAFVTAPSFLPEDTDSMRKSIAVIECRSQLELTINGKVVAVANEMTKDSTLATVKTKSDSCTIKKYTILGCWANRWTFLPWCSGRILSINPIAEKEDILKAFRADTLIARTIRSAEKTMETCRQRKVELDYYLNTHSVKDDGYEDIVEIAEQNTKLSKDMETQIKLLGKLKSKKGIKLRMSTTYALLYSADGKKMQSVGCDIVKNEEYKKNGIIVLQTKDKFMTKGANPIYEFKVFNINMEKGDSITTAAIFGLDSPKAKSAALREADTFKGVMKDSCTHDIPQLLAPDGAPMFSNRGFFVGLNLKGRIVR